MAAAILFFLSSTPHRRSSPFPSISTTPRRVAALRCARDTNRIWEPGRNKTESMFALEEEEVEDEVVRRRRSTTTTKRLLDAAPSDLAAAVEAGRAPETMLARFVELQKSPLTRWLMRSSGFRERLLADDLFLAKLAMECGVGIITKTTAEFERRREHFGHELGFVLADVVMALIADFMLVWLPAPTISLRSPLSFSTNPVTKFFYGCPDNAFQVELAGTSYSLPQRIGAIMRNGIKLFVIGTAASLIGTGMTDALIIIRKVLDKDYAGAAGDIPILQTSVGYGVYMAVSSNLRYQLLAGVVEQRILEPVLCENKLMLTLVSFAFRTGNTFLGSLMWVDYARLIGIQEICG